ncbi:MAG: bile acid:sodium symporter [Treponema sp.]|jgi:predicted Na+-dependent transporter|nr:bile acid:sodium symporter [Treponema sp.]
MSYSSEVAQNINRHIERLMPILSPLGIVLGFTLPGIFIHLRPLVPWLFGLITLAGALRMRTAEFGTTIRSPLPILLFFVTGHILTPLIGFAVASRCFSNMDTVAGFVLLLSGPTAVSGFMWVSIYRGDKALCLTLILLDTLLAPFVVPGAISILMGAHITMDMTGIAISLLMMIVIPTIVGVSINEASRGSIPALVCPYLEPFSKICLMLVIAANASPVAPRVRLDDPGVWGVAAVCILLSVTGFIISKAAAIAGKCNAEKGIALFFCGGLRNISAVTTIAVTFFPEAAALPALLGIVFQQSIAAVMGNINSRLDKRR